MVTHSVRTLYVYGALRTYGPVNTRFVRALMMKGPLERGVSLSWWTAYSLRVVVTRNAPHGITRSATRKQPVLTQPNDDTPTSSEQQNTDASPSEGYKWTCPYCGTSRVNTASVADGQGNAIVALRNHITTSVGGGHSQQNKFPTENVSLADYVTWVE